MQDAVVRAVATLGWMAVVVTAALALRPPPPRVRALIPRRQRPPAPVLFVGVRGPLAHGRAARRRQAAVSAAIPDVTDLFAVAVTAGLNVRLAVEAVAARAPDGPVADALTSAVREVAAGARLADALDRVVTALGPPIRPLVTALTDADHYGAALGLTLERLADDARGRRQRAAEAAARRVPVKLLFPLVTCILPAFGLMTVAPLIAGGLRALRP